MMLKYCFTAIIVLGTYVSSFGQLNNPDSKAVVYYEDGSVFIGTIVFEDNWQVNLLTTTMDTLHLAKKDFKKFFRSSDKILLLKRGKFHYTKGFFAHISLGAGIEEFFSEYRDLIIGYRLNKRWDVGIGIGQNSKSSNLGSSFWINHSFIPIYGFGRYYLFNKINARPFISYAMGYGFPVNEFFGDEHSGGFFAKPGIGVQFASKNSFRFNISLEQDIQYTDGFSESFDAFNNTISSNYNYWFNRTVLKFGLEFK